MLIRIRDTGEVVTDQQFRADRPNTSFPPVLSVETLNDFGADPVLEGARPTGEPWQTTVSDGYEQVGDQWFTKYRLEPAELDEDGLNRQRDLKLAALAAKRWEVETGGIVVSGVPVKTDEDTQRKITGAYVQAVRNPDFTVRWKLGPAQFITLDATTVIAIGDAVTQHIQSAFDHEATVTDQIVEADDWSALAAVDIDQGWSA